MIRLIRSELLRARSRRMPIGVVLVLSLCLVLAAVIVVIDDGEVVDLTDRWVDALPGGSYYLVWLFGGVGASLVGAEFRSGGITQLVNWDPRRGYVVAAKLIAAGITGAVCAVVLAGVACLVAGALVASGHLVAGVDSLGSTEARVGVALVAATSLASASGAALAFVLRSSVGALVAVSASMLVVEPLAGWLLDGLARRGPFHALIALTGTPDSATVPDGGDLAAGVTVAVWVVLMGALAYQAFVAHDLRDAD